MTDMTNPLMAKLKMPGQHFRLPSGGVLYNNGELSADVKNGEVEVSPLTTVDELILKSPDRLLSGEAITEVFKNCIPQVLKPTELFAKDVDYLLTCLKMMTFGDEAEIELQHDCENAERHSYVISLGEIINKSKNIDQSTISEHYTLSLDNGQTVTLLPPRHRDVVDMYQFMSKARDDNDTSLDTEVTEIRETLRKTMLGMIAKVDDIDDKDLIDEWLQHITAKWAKTISESISTLSDWGPDFNVEVECKDCHKKFKTNTPLNPVAFFF